MMNMLAETAAAWGIPLTTTQLDQFATYADELRHWNERVNLTAITDQEGIVSRHFLDSLRCAQSWGNVPQRLIDVGTGAGFPGLALKIAYPEIALTLVESIAKKATFLRHMVNMLNLQHVEVVVARAEAVGHDPAHREHYDVVVARAVADLRVLVEYCLPLCRVGGRFLAPKGSQINDEVTRAQSAIKQLGGQLLCVEPVDVPGVEQRALVVIEKRKPTPAQFPRAVGVPGKKPL